MRVSKYIVVTMFIDKLVKSGIVSSKNVLYYIFKNLVSNFPTYVINIGFEDDYESLSNLFCKFRAV